MAKVRIYVDGFNLYNRALKNARASDGSTYKWLDLNKLGETILHDPSKYQIDGIRYFTARVHALPRDPDAPARQGQYLRALRTIPHLEVHYGLFKLRDAWMELVTPLPVIVMPLPPKPCKVLEGVKVYPDGGQTAFVRKFSEKGSDVNLASYLILDAALNRFDVAAVITNDSDLVQPIRLVREEFKKDVLVFDPSQDRSSAELKDACTFYKPIRLGPIAASQFPATLTDKRGSFGKPAGW